MRKFIIEKQEFSPISCSFFDEYSHEDIRRLQWRNLILNDYNEFKHTKAFYGCITRHNDYRINKVFKETICYRKEYLKNEHVFDKANNHIDNSIYTEQKINAEVLTLYVIKYSYFIRNKSFHGEKIDPAFHIVKSDEIKELDVLNTILGIFLKELISINKYY